MVQRCRVAVWRSWGSACCRRSANIGLSKGWSSSQTGHDYEDEQSHGTILTRPKWAKAPMQQAGQRGTEKATCVGRTNFMPPKSISACGDRAAKVRKVLIRFNRMRRKLRNLKPAQIPPRHCLSSKCGDPQARALLRSDQGVQPPAARICDYEPCDPSPLFFEKPTAIQL